MIEDWIEAEQLHFAAADGDAGRVAELIGAGYDPNAFDGLGKTPLHYAVANEHYGVITYLLTHGADVNAHDEQHISNTPLADVAQTCSLRMAQLLIDAGADPRITGWMQLNALDRASERKRGEGPQVYELLRNFAERRRSPRQR